MPASASESFMQDPLNVLRCEERTPTRNPMRDKPACPDVLEDGAMRQPDEVRKFFRRNLSWNANVHDIALIPEEFITCI